MGLLTIRRGCLPLNLITVGILAQGAAIPKADLSEGTLSGVPAVLGPERSRRAPERAHKGASFDYAATKPLLHSREACFGTFELLAQGKLGGLPRMGGPSAHYAPASGNAILSR